MINLKVSKKQAQFIVECLLFSSGCDVNSEWDKNDIDELISLAFDIKTQNNDLKLKNIYIHNPLLSEENVFIDPMTSEIISKFPEILKEDI